MLHFEKEFQYLIRIFDYFSFVIDKSEKEN